MRVRDLIAGGANRDAKMLEFAVQHDIKPVIESYSFDQINEAMARVRSGEARYRVVLSRR
jgi:uncharacterized zinc-type alcohol dehydrogenase-like protein